MRLNTKPVRVDANWENKMRDIMGERMRLRLSNPTIKEMGLPEATRLTLKCPSWSLVEKELRSLPKKR